MTALRVAGGRVVDPAAGRDRVCDLWILDGVIAAAGEAPTGFPTHQTIDATGLVVCPGLVDLGARLCEPGATHKGSIASETSAAAAGGVTKICCPPDTHPVIDTPATVELVHQRAFAANHAHVRAIGALTVGLAGEYLAPMRALVQAGAAYVGTRVLDRLFAVAADIQINLVLIQGKPGQIFDPLRDLLDRFSTLILVALGSLTLQKVLLQLSGDVAVAFFGGCALGVLLLGVLLGPRRAATSCWSAAGLLLGTVVFLRLLLPLSALAVAEVSERVLAPRQQAAGATIERAGERIGLDLDLTGDVPQATEQNLGRSVAELESSARALRTVDEGWLKSLFDAFVDLVAVFAIETLIVPLVALFLLWRLWRRLIPARAPPS